MKKSTYVTTDVEMDKETGMPVLPEDYFWRIEKRWEPESYRNDHNELALLICKNVPVKRWGWFGPKNPTEVRTYCYQPMAEYKKFPVGTEPSYDNTEGWRFSGGWTDRSTYVKVPEPSGETVLKYALIALADFERQNLETEKKQSREEAAAKLIGDYPPKKLVK